MVRRQMREEGGGSLNPEIRVSTADKTITVAVQYNIEQQT